MDFGQGSGTVKFTVALEGQNVGAIRPHLKRGCWGGAKQYCSFWKRQDLHTRPEVP